MDLKSKCQSRMKKLIKELLETLLKKLFWEIPRIKLAERIPNITFKIYSVLTAVEELMVKFQGLPVLLKGFLEVFKIIPQEASWEISEAISEKIPDAISE